MPIPVNKKTGKQFKTGKLPRTAADMSRLLKARPHLVIAAPPPEFAIVPAKVDVWGNDRYGVCVTSEEAYAKSCGGYFITEAEVIRWARAHGVLNGASLTGVLDDMVEKGFVDGKQLYNDGPWDGVSFQDETTLRSALTVGPVKIAIRASALPSGAGNDMGWYTTSARNTNGTDHCVSLSGYGPAGFLYQELGKKFGVSLPSGLPGDTQGYLLFTWGTIGFVTWKWLMGTCDEAEVRSPTTVGVPPLAPPVPPTPPGPPAAPPLMGSFRIDGGVIRGTANLTITQPWSGSADYKIVPAAGGQFVFEPRLPS